MRIRCSKANRGGFAVILVLVVAFILCAIASNNGRTLHQLKQEIQLVEKKQERETKKRLQSAPERARIGRPARGKGNHD